MNDLDENKETLLVIENNFFVALRNYRLCQEAKKDEIKKMEAEIREKQKNADIQKACLEVIKSTSPIVEENAKKNMTDIQEDFGEFMGSFFGANKKQDFFNRGEEWCAQRIENFDCRLQETEKSWKDTIAELSEMKTALSLLKELENDRQELIKLYVELESYTKEILPAEILDDEKIEHLFIDSAMRKIKKATTKEELIKAVDEIGLFKTSRGSNVDIRQLKIRISLVMKAPSRQSYLNEIQYVPSAYGLRDRAKEIWKMNASNNPESIEKLAEVEVSENASSPSYRGLGK